MRRWGDLLATIGEYEDAAGRKCKRQAKVGVIMRDDSGNAWAVKIDLLPTSPSWSGWLAIRNINGAVEEDPDGDQGGSCEPEKQEGS
jgi:hypothetical protein